MKTIVQAIAAPEFLGREGYGALQGAITAPTHVVRALTPFSAAALWTWSGSYTALLWMLAGISLLSLGAYVGAVLLHEHAEPRSRGG